MGSKGTSLGECEGVSIKWWSLSHLWVESQYMQGWGSKFLQFVFN